jgi:hypothetical protein
MGIGKEKGTALREDCNQIEERDESTSRDLGEGKGIERVKDLD